MHSHIDLAARVEIVRAKAEDLAYLKGWLVYIGNLQLEGRRGAHADLLEPEVSPIGADKEGLVMVQLLETFDSVEHLKLAEQNERRKIAQREMNIKYPTIYVIRFTV